MKTKWQITLMLSVLIAALMVTSFPMAQVAEAKGGGTRIALHGSSRFPTAKGTAKYKASGTEREFQVEVENVKVLAGQTLVVFVDGKKVGSFVVNALGAGRLNLNTIRGNKVPLIKAGSKVQVKAPGKGLVVSGQF